MRNDTRIFRLERIDELELLSKTFRRPADFVMQSDRNGDRNLIVRVLFDRETARWVREARTYYMIAEEDTPDGLLVTLKMRQESEILQWLLSWGRHVRVLEPHSLQQRLLEEAQEMVRNNKYT